MGIWESPREVVSYAPIMEHELKNDPSLKPGEGRFKLNQLMGIISAPERGDVYPRGAD